MINEEYVLAEQAALAALAGKTIAEAVLDDETELRLTTTDGVVFTASTCRCCGIAFTEEAK